MTKVDATLLVLVGYRIAGMLMGLAALYMGFRLFRLGFFEKAGDLKAAWGEHRLILKQAAPGSFFAVLGAVVMVVWSS